MDNNPPVQVEGKTQVYYFASPYSSEHTYIRETRYLKALLAAGELHNQGYALIEPIGMSHHTAKVCSLPTGYAHWKERDRAFIDHSDGLIVLVMDGWLESVGVTDEINYTFETGKPVWAYVSNYKDNNDFGILTKEGYDAMKAKLLPTYV